MRNIHQDEKPENCRGSHVANGFEHHPRMPPINQARFKDPVFSIPALLHDAIPQIKSRPADSDGGTVADESKVH